ncbi:hypothetical protein [Streptomyces sp. NPDC005004]
MLAETICSAVSAAGLGIAAVTAYRKRFLTAARVVAYSLVPVGLVMTGVVGWLARTALSPLAWAGFGVLALSVVLFLLTRAVERRRDRAGKGAIRSAESDPVAPAASAPSLGRGSGRASRPAAPPAATGSGDDFSDIEAILKKHGI